MTAVPLLHARGTPDSQGGELEQYLSEVAETYCPFIHPSNLDRALLFARYDCRNLDRDSLPRWLFLLGVTHAEILLVRQQQGSPRQAHLVSENIIIDRELSGDEMIEILGLPHNLLKVLYAESGLVFGKFAAGLSEKSSINGRSLPTSPIHFLAIRTLIEKKDGRFFVPTPGLQHYAGAHQGESPLNEMASSPDSQAAVASLRQLAGGTFDQAKASGLLTKLWRSPLFEETVPWARKKLAEVAPA
jgi:hypothetical protein